MSNNWSSYRETLASFHSFNLFCFLQLIFLGIFALIKRLFKFAFQQATVYANVFK